MAIPETRNLSYQGANLPQVTEADDGKVLGVVGGKWKLKKDEADPELPVPTIADAGKIPSVNAQGKYALTTPENKLPAVSPTDNGDVLAVVDGKWGKAEAPKELPVLTAQDNGKTVLVDGGVYTLANPAKGVETISLSAEDEAAYQTAIVQFLTAALQASGTPTQIAVQVSLDIFDDVMTALDNGKAVIVNTSLGKGIVTQSITGSAFVFRLCALNYPISAEATASADTVVYVNEHAIGFYGYATLVS